MSVCDGFNSRAGGLLGGGGMSIPVFLTSMATELSWYVGISPAAVGSSPVVMVQALHRQDGLRCGRLELKRLQQHFVGIMGNLSIRADAFHSGIPSSCLCLKHSPSQIHRVPHPHSSCGGDYGTQESILKKLCRFPGSAGRTDSSLTGLPLRGLPGVCAQPQREEN